VICNAAETTIEVHLAKESNMRALLLGPALEIKADAGEPHWVWVYSEEEWQAESADCAQPR
jgi:hypothetical protein